MSGHHCPLILGSCRSGWYFQCRCGVVGTRVFTGARGASYDWALHILDRARRKRGTHVTVA